MKIWLALFTVGAFSVSYADESSWRVHDFCVRDLQFIAQNPQIAHENHFSTFETFQDVSPEHAHACNLARRWAETRERDYQTSSSLGLVLIGPPGVGKTHLAVAAAREMIAQGRNILYLTADKEFRTPRLPPLPTAGITSPSWLAEINIFNARRLVDLVSIEETLRPYDGIVLDDLNPSSPNWAPYYANFVEIIHWAHRNPNKRILVTTNADSETFRAPLNQENTRERARLLDRYKTLFVEHGIKGKSFRPVACWGD